MTKSKKKPVRFGDPDPSDRDHNPFLPVPDEEAEFYATPYHRYRSSDGRVIEYVRSVSDHVGFIRVLIEPEPKDLPADLKGPWTGFADLHKKIVQYFEGKGLTLKIMEPHEEFADKARQVLELRDYPRGPRFDSR